MKIYTLKIIPAGLNKWSDKRGVFVTIYEEKNRSSCKEGSDGVLGITGHGKTPRVAIQNFIFRKFYFDGGREKYYPYKLVS